RNRNALRSGTVGQHSRHYGRDRASSYRSDRRGPGSLRYDRSRDERHPASCERRDQQRNRDWPWYCRTYSQGTYQKYHAQDQDNDAHWNFDESPWLSWGSRTSWGFQEA